MSDLMVKGPVFHGVRFDIVDANGEKWVTVKQLAEALGYEDRRQLIRLIRRNEPEFKGKLFVVKLTTNSPGAPELIISYHGVIRASMLSDAPRAREFRDWAETILFAVMTGAAETIHHGVLSKLARLERWGNLLDSRRF